jgi:hypothetical protein
VASAAAGASVAAAGAAVGAGVDVALELQPASANTMIAASNKAVTLFVFLFIFSSSLVQTPCCVCWFLNHLSTVSSINMGKITMEFGHSGHFVNSLWFLN